MLPSPFGAILAAGRRVALPGARLERGIKLRINRAVPVGLIRGKSEGLVLPRPPMQGEPVPATPADGFDLPEGLKRQQMGPYSRDKGGRQR